MRGATWRVRCATLRRKAGCGECGSQHLAVHMSVRTPAATATPVANDVADVALPRTLDKALRTSLTKNGYKFHPQAHKIGVHAQPAQEGVPLLAALLQQVVGEGAVVLRPMLASPHLRHPLRCLL